MVAVCGRQAEIVVNRPRPQFSKVVRHKKKSRPDGRLRFNREASTRIGSIRDGHNRPIR